MTDVEADQINIRKLTNSEIIRYSFQLLFKNIKYIAMACVAAYVPLYTISEIYGYPTESVARLNESFTAGATPAIADVSELLKYFSVVGILFVIFSPIVIGVVSNLALAEVDGRKASWSDVINWATLKWGRIMFTSLLRLLLLLVLFTSFVIPGLIGLVVFMYAECISAVSDTFGFRALIDSIRATKGFFLLSVVLLISIYAISLFAWSVFGLLIGEQAPALIVIFETAAQILMSFEYAAISLRLHNIYRLKALAATPSN